MSKQYGRISTKLSISLAVRLLLVTLLATVVSYLHITNIVTQLINHNLEEYIRVRGERDSQTFIKARVASKRLAARISKYLDQEPIATPAEFNRIFEKYSDGIFRQKKDTNTLEHAQFFLSPSAPFTPAWKNLVMKFRDVLERECFTSLIEFSDCWAEDTYGSLGIFFPTERKFTIDTSHSQFLKSAGRPNIELVGPKNNPNRDQLWSKSYLDPVSKLWMVSLAAPIYYHDQFIGAIGNDIALGEILLRTVNIGIEGTHTFIFNSDGTLIASPEYLDQITASKATLNVRDVDDPSFARAYQLSKQINSDGSTLTSVTSDALVAVADLYGPDWYIATVYPKPLITAAAMKASSTVLTCGILSLICEILILMWLLQRKLGNPLKGMVSAVEKAGKGDLSVKINTGTRDELDKLGEAFNDMTYNLELSRSEVQAAMEKALAASKAKSQFVANMSHEIRTPLNGILGIAHLIKDTPLNDEQKKYADIISDSGNLLLAIVNQVLDIAKIEQKKYDLNQTCFNLPLLFDEVKSSCHFAAFEKGLPLDFAVNLQENQHVWSDSTRIKEILVNLIGNAIKFSDVGTVTLTVDELARTEKNIKVRFAVRDQGPGIAKEVQEKLFVAFYQADDSNSRKHGGTGLGLFLCKSAVTRLGGDIEVKSELGEGAEFSFTLDLNLCDSPEALASSGEAETRIGTDSTLILVAEDNPVNQLMTKTLLKKMGLECVIAENGEKTVEEFKKGIYTLVLMDCQMPVMDGYDATRAIRALENSGKRIPIVALTANALTGDRERCLDCGMDDMLPKPVKIPVFKEKLEHWLKIALGKA